MDPWIQQIRTTGPPQSDGTGLWFLASSVSLCEFLQLLILWHRIALTISRTFASSVYATGVYEIAAKFDVSVTSALLGLSLYVVGLGLG